MLQVDMTKSVCIICDSLQKRSQNHNSRPLKIKKLTGILGLSLGIFLAVGIIVGPGSMVAYGTEYSQYAATQTNDCGNGFFASGVNCANDLSTIQGDNNIIVSESITPSTHGPYTDGGHSYNMESAGKGTSDSNQGAEIPDGTKNGDSGNPVGSAVEDPSLRVFPCCDEMPIAVNV